MHNFNHFILSITFLFFFTVGHAQEAVKLKGKAWTFKCQRDEIAPEYGVDKILKYNGKETMTLSGGGKDYANGSWTADFEVVSGRFYDFSVHFKVSDVEEPARSIVAKITWLDKDGKRTGFKEYPDYAPDEQKKEWQQVRQVYQVPEGVAKARVELVYRWDADGQVWFGGVDLMEVTPPAPRMVRLAAIHHRPRNTKSPEENLNQYARYLHEAGNQKADIVCLPEGITLVGNGKTYVEVSEPVPGPTTQFLGQIAKEHQMYIVAGILERDGPVVYNTAVLLGRDGELVGKYRKVSLPREEIEGGVTPGNSFPVFDLDFGRVGMMICWDVTFPEPASALASQGAEVIFMPIWGGNINLAKARAIENQVYLVSSTYDMKTGVFDLEGELMAEGTVEAPVAIVEVDLNTQKLWPFLGEYKNRIARERPPKGIE